MLIFYLIGVLISIILYSIILGIIDSINQFLRNKCKSELNIDKFEYSSIAVLSFLWPIVVPTIIFCLFIYIIRTITSVIALKIFYLINKIKKER